VGIDTDDIGGEALTEVRLTDLISVERVLAYWIAPVSVARSTHQFVNLIRRELVCRINRWPINSSLSAHHDLHCQLFSERLKWRACNIRLVIVQRIDSRLSLALLHRLLVSVVEAGRLERGLSLGMLL
jgi:hypothetical protein